MGATAARHEWINTIVSGVHRWSNNFELRNSSIRVILENKLKKNCLTQTIHLSSKSFTKLTSNIKIFQNGSGPNMLVSGVKGSISHSYLEISLTGVVR